MNSLASTHLVKINAKNVPVLPIPATLPTTQLIDTEGLLLNHEMLILENIQIPKLSLIPDFHEIILEIFDNFIVPTISAPTHVQKQVKIFITRKLLSNNTHNLLLQVPSFHHPV